MASDKLMTQAEFSKAMGVSRETCSRWILKGMPATRIHGRRLAIDMDQAKLWLRNRHGPELMALPGQKYDAPQPPPPVPFETPDPGPVAPDLTAQQLSRALLESQIARNRQIARKNEIANRRASTEWMRRAQAIKAIGETQHMIVTQLLYAAPRLTDLLVGKSRDEMWDILDRELRELVMDIGVTKLGDAHERSWAAHEHATGQPEPNMDEDGNLLADLDELECEGEEEIDDEEQD